MMDVKLVITEDGSHTLAVPSLEEHYHSVHGAVSESKHVFINAGLNYILQNKTNLNILEIGFGTGLNAILTLIELSGKKVFCEYTSVDLHPLAEEIYSKLNYPAILCIPNTIFLLLHQSKWNKKEKINECFALHKIHSSIHDILFFEEKFDLVYFDAFGPGKQPDMWTAEVFGKISSSMNADGILTTYSTKGSVKRILKETGFIIEKLPGPKGKREILRAKKIF